MNSEDHQPQQFSQAARLKNLRVRRQLKWRDMAALLEVSPSMIYQVLADKRRLSDKALFRLESAEIEASLKNATFDRVLREPSRVPILIFPILICLLMIAVAIATFFIIQTIDLKATNRILEDQLHEFVLKRNSQEKAQDLKSPN